MPSPPASVTEPVKAEASSTLSPRPPVNVARSMPLSVKAPPVERTRLVSVSVKSASFADTTRSMPAAPASVARPVQRETSNVLSPGPPLRLASSIDVRLKLPPFERRRLQSLSVKSASLTDTRRSVPTAPSIMAMPV